MDPKLTFYDAKQIRELANRAFDAFHRAAELSEASPDKESRLEPNLAWDAAVHALRFCEHAIAALRDPALFDLALEIHEVAGWRIRDTSYIHSDGTLGLGALIRSGLGVGELEVCASHDSTAIRQALAEWIPAVPDNVAVLWQLCEDPEPAVRTRARAKLEQVSEVPWWAGKFSADPFATMSAEQAARHKRAVLAIGKALGERRLDPHAAARALRLAAKFPPVAGCDVVRRLARAGDLGTEQRSTSARLAAKLLVRAGEVGEKLAEELLSTAPKNSAMVLDHYLAAVRAEPRLRIVSKSMEVIEELVDEEAAWDSPLRPLAELVKKHWPKEVDPTPVIELALARSERHVDGIAGDLAEVLQRTSRFEFLRSQVVPVHLKGYPDAWKSLHRECEAALRRLPRPERAGLGRRSLESGVESAVKWAIAGRLREAEARHDGSARRLALELDAQPALRPVLRRHFTHTLIPRLRTELAEGKLDFAVAHRVMRFLGRHGGGVLGMAPVDWQHEITPKYLERPVKPTPEERRYLGRHRLGGGPTAQEWAAYRRARAIAELKDAREAFGALQLTPSERPWHPDDRALFGRALQLAEGEFDDWLLVQLGWVAFSLGEPEDLQVLDRLVALAGMDPFARPSLLNMRTAWRKRLGLREPSAAKAAPPEDSIDQGWEEAD